jgi:muramoyltetrapeptide carboxypeptidase LdcA involved in peptidoglycan recycling
MDIQPIIPAPLQPGDTVAFVSPSLRLNQVYTQALARAKQCLVKQGFKVLIIDGGEPSGDFNDQISQRCEEIHEAFRRPEVKAIITTVGGSNSHELLPHLDYQLIKENPKIFCGYSDTTSLHYGIFTQTGLQTFYGPMAIYPLGEHPEPLPFTVENFLRVITELGSQPLGGVPYSLEWSPEFIKFWANPARLLRRRLQPNPGWRWLRTGSAQGRIFGGCMEPMMHMPGTKFWPDFTDRILLLETSVGENPEQGIPLEVVAAQLATLRNLGVFWRITGLVMGRPYGYSDSQKKRLDQVILDHTRDLTFPILVDVDIGHTDPLLTIPLNTMVSLDSVENSFSFLEASVQPPE